jgi:hypothetical protein
VVLGCLAIWKGTYRIMHDGFSFVLSVDYGAMPSRFDRKGLDDSYTLKNRAIDRGCEWGGRSAFLTSDFPHEPARWARVSDGWILSIDHDRDAVRSHSHCMTR